MNLVRK